MTNAIQEWIERVAITPVDGEEGPADVCVIELGGTIGTEDISCTRKFSLSKEKRFWSLRRYLFLHAGDIESMPFIEALGQLSHRAGKVISVNFYVQGNQKSIKL